MNIIFCRAWQFMINFSMIGLHVHRKWEGAAYLMDGVVVCCPGKVQWAVLNWFWKIVWLLSLMFGSHWSSFHTMSLYYDSDAIYLSTFFYVFFFCLFLRNLAPLGGIGQVAKVVPIRHRSVLQRCALWLFFLCKALNLLIFSILLWKRMKIKFSIGLFLHCSCSFCRPFYPSWFVLQ